MSASDRLLPLAKVADILGAQPSTLRNWRHREEGPPSFKVRGLVVYRQSELLAWIKDQEASTRRGGDT